jgi:hypothetical protein
MEVKNISYIELSGFHERLLTLFLQAGLEQGPTLDRALGNAMTVIIQEIDAVRQGRIDKRSRIKLVENEE